LFANQRLLAFQPGRRPATWGRLFRDNGTPKGDQPSRQDGNPGKVVGTAPGAVNFIVGAGRRPTDSAFVGNR
jgi:hypothetical protein